VRGGTADDAATATPALKKRKEKNCKKFIFTLSLQSM